MSLERLYDGWFESSLLDGYYDYSGYLNVGYWGDGAHTQTEACRALVRRLLRGVAPGARRVLDVGCGTGATTLEIHRQLGAATTVGVNLSSRQLMRARQRNEAATADPRVGFVCMDAASMALASASVDLVVCVEAAFHFDTRERFFEEAYRVMRPGGILAASDMLYGSYDGLAALLVPPGNRIVDVAGYQDRLRSAGFADIVVEEAREACWQGYREHLGRWLDRAVEGGRLAEAEGEAMRANADALDVAGYLLVRAVKPEGRR